MAFTYTDGVDSDLNNTRLEIGDTVEKAGPRPAGTNYSDAEINYAITAEGSVILATARLCEILSREYAAYAGLQMLQEHSESYRNQSSDFAKRAEYIRDNDATSAAAKVTSGSFTRVDGYSSTIASDEI